MIARAGELVVLAEKMGLLPQADTPDPVARLEGALAAGHLSASTLAELARELPATPVDGERYELGAPLGAGSSERFFSGARAQARVEHPNVCKVFEARGGQEGARIPMKPMCTPPSRPSRRKEKKRSASQRVQGGRSSMCSGRTPARSSRTRVARRRSM
jgi:hypothetical protein